MPDILTPFITVGLLVLSGVFSGLNIGLMMARPDDLRRKAQHGDEIAARVYRYRKDGYYLIFCILLGNVGVNTAMSILLGNITNGVVGGIVATLLITLFGEILPQAIFSQRGYRLTRYFFWLLDIIYVLFWPLARPVSHLLGRWLGREGPALYSHNELEQIIREHAAHADSTVDYDEGRIATGALRFSKKRVADIATPRRHVYCVNRDDQLDAALLSQIKRAGHSRIPVCHDGVVVGLLYLKDIVGRTLPLPISRVSRDKVHHIDARSGLDTALSRFIQTHSHLFVVTDQRGKQVGIITLEDVIEQIINQQIEDEFDIAAKTQ